MVAGQGTCFLSKILTFKTMYFYPIKKIHFRKMSLTECFLYRIGTFLRHSKFLRILKTIIWACRVSAVLSEKAVISSSSSG